MPYGAMRLVDAHIHLTDKEYSGYIKHVLDNLKALKIMACSMTVNLETLTRSLELFGNHITEVIPFGGIHPEYALTEDVAGFIEILERNSKSIHGIGEIGLDPTYTGHEEGLRERQKRVFLSMLKYAEKTNKPISIHSRGSLDEILDILGTYNVRNVLLHWFAGSKKQLARSMEMGLFVSYGPVLIYSEEKKALLKHTAKDKFLAETDGPVRYQRCFGNVPSMSSSLLVSVVNCAANVLKMSYLDTTSLLEKNAESYLGMKLC
jgi:TatD DNase family protein